MSSWRDLSKNAWSFTKKQIVGIGGGIGSNKIAYAINLESGILLNGKIEANIKLLNRNKLAAAGLICRADELWTFLAIYFLYNPNTDSTFMGIGVCERGTLSPIFALNEKIILDDTYNHFELEFFSGRIVDKLKTSGKEYKIEKTVPHIAFPGYVGIVKLYDAEVVVKNFQTGDLVLPVEIEEQRMYKFDVFISHSSKDKSLVDLITADFRNVGVRYWVDGEQIGFGQSITEQIENGLQNSKHVLVCLSSNLGKSNWCRAEYAAILHKYFSGATNKRVIPLVLDNVSNDDIPSLLYDLRRAKYINKDEFNELMNYLKS